VPGTVDPTRNVIVVTTTHLSWWELIIPCDEPFGLTDAQEFAYEEARDYLNALLNHQDLFEALTTSDGVPLFEVNASGARWLSKQSLCDLDRAGAEGISKKLGVDLTPQQVTDAMVTLGKGLRSQSYASNTVREMWEAIGKASSATSLAIVGAKVIAFGPLAGVELVSHFFLDLFIEPLWNIAFDLAYLGELSREFSNFNEWLQPSYTEEVGQSGMNRVPANQIDLCNVNYSTSKGFYQITLQGSLIFEDPFAYGFINLYRRSGTVYFAIALQTLGAFGDWHLTSIVDRTDDVIVLLEYEEPSRQKRVARLLLENSKVLPICVLGKMGLPDIRPGSEVKVTYYFIEDGHLDKRFDSDGVKYPIPPGEHLCYGVCSGPNRPPNQPSNPIPADGADDQRLGVNLSWTGGDPDGNTVTYDVYFAPDDSTPDVLVSDDQSGTTYDLGTLSTNTHYYWQIEAQDEWGEVTTGPVWDFTTGEGGGPTSTTTIASFQGPYIGLSVSGAGDVNGDGYADAITANSHDVGAFIYFGGTEVETSPGVYLPYGNISCCGGETVSSAGDVNGDGFDDVIVGDSRAGDEGNAYENAYVFFGGAAMDGVADVTIPNPRAGIPPTNFGASVSSAGDINGDGFDDVVVGDCWGYRAYVYFGGPLMNGVADLNLAHTGWFGASVAGGDFNGDGYDDIIVGAYYDSSDELGRAYVYFGGPSPDGSADLILSGVEGDRFGISVDSAGDVNSDGIDDIIVGAAASDVLGTNTGQAYIFYGGTDMDTQYDIVMTGDGAGDRFGEFVASAGDVNQDGYDDALVDTEANRAYLFWGGPLMGGNNYTMLNAGAGNLSGAGDVNGDGYDDIIVGFGDEDYPYDGSVVIYGIDNSVTQKVSAFRLGDLRTQYRTWSR
jgi:hypothetical protein